MFAVYPVSRELNCAAARAAGVAFLAVERGSDRREPIIPAAACPPGPMHNPRQPDREGRSATSLALCHDVAPHHLAKALRGRKLPFQAIEFQDGPGLNPAVILPWLCAC